MGYECQRSLRQWTHTTFCLVVGGVAAQGAWRTNKNQIRPRKHNFYFLCQFKVEFTRVKIIWVPKWFHHLQLLILLKPSGTVGRRQCEKAKSRNLCWPLSPKSALHEQLSTEHGHLGSGEGRVTVTSRNCIKKGILKMHCTRLLCAKGQWEWGSYSIILYLCPTNLAADGCIIMKSDHRLLSRRTFGWPETKLINLYMYIICCGRRTSVELSSLTLTT